MQQTTELLSLDRLNDTLQGEFSCKVIKICRACGAEFMSYAYHKLRNCEDCRSAARKKAAS